MSKSLKKLIDINRLREFKNKLVRTGSAYVQTSAVNQTIAGTKTFSKPIVGSVTGSSGSCTGNAATATTAATASSVPWSGVTGKPSTFTPSSHTHDGRYYTENEVNNLLNGKANTSHRHNSVGTSDYNHNILFDWSSKVSGHVGLRVDVTDMGGIVTTNNLDSSLGHIGVYDIGSTIHACTGIQVEYGATVAGSALKYAATDTAGGIYDLNRHLTTVGTWLKVSGNSSNTGGFGLYRRIA